MSTENQEIVISPAKIILDVFASIPNFGEERSQMPQITNVQLFLNEIRKRGIGVVQRKLTPTQILPSQKELSEEKITKNHLKSIERDDDTYWMHREYIVSKDFYLVDGHHDWCMSLLHAGKERMRSLFMNVFIVDLTIPHLLDVARTCAGTEFKTLHENEVLREGFAINGLHIQDKVRHKYTNVTGRIISFKGQRNEIAVIASEPHNLKTEVPVNGLICLEYHDGTPAKITESESIEQQFFTTILECEQHFRDVISRCRKVAYRNSIHYYTNDRTAPLIAVDKIPNAYIASIYDKELVESYLSEHYVTTIPDVMKASLRNNKCAMSIHSYDHINHILTTTIHIEADWSFDNATIKKFATNVLDNLCIVFPFENVMHDTSTISSGESIISGHNKMIGVVKDGSMYINLVTRVKVNLTDISTCSIVSKLVNKYVSNSSIMRPECVPNTQNDGAILFMSVQMTDAEYDVHLREYAKINKLPANTNLIELGKNLKNEIIDPYALLLNGNNPLFNELCQSGFAVIPVGIYDAHTVSAISSRSVYVGNKYFRFDIVPLSLHESLRLAKSVYELTGDAQILCEVDSLGKDALEMFYMVESYDMPLNEAVSPKEVLNFLLGKGNKIRSFGGQLQQALIQTLTARLEVENRLDNVASETKEKMLEIADQKAKTNRDLADSIYDKIDNIADGDDRLKRIARRVRVNAELEANKKKLEYLKKLEKDTQAKDIAQKIQDQQEQAQELLDEEREQEAMDKEDVKNGKVPAGTKEGKDEEKNNATVEQAKKDLEKLKDVVNNANKETLKFEEELKKAKESKDDAAIKAAQNKFKSAAAKHANTVLAYYQKKLDIAKALDDKDAQEKLSTEITKVKETMRKSKYEEERNKTDEKAEDDKKVELESLEKDTEDLEKEISDKKGSVDWYNEQLELPSTRGQKRNKLVAEQKEVELDYAALLKDLYRNKAKIAELKGDKKAEAEFVKKAKKQENTVGRLTKTAPK